MGKTLPVRVKLAHRLALSFLLPTAIALAAMALLSDHVARLSFEQQLSQRLITIAHSSRAMLGGYFSELLARVDEQDQRSRATLQKRIQAVAEETGARRIFVFKPGDLTSIIDTREDVPFGSRYYEIEADSIELNDVAQGHSRASVLYTDENGTPYKYAYAPIRLGDDIIAIIGVEGSSEQFSELQSFRQQLLLLVAITLVLVTATAWFVARRLESVVARLRDGARRIGEGNLSEPLLQSRGDELGELELELDHMRQALSSRDEEMQMMLAGIAHEIRNPLGGIELFLGLLDDDLEKDDPRRQHVSRVQKEIGYLSRVVGEFLDFARKGNLRFSVFDASRFAAELEQLMNADVQHAELDFVAKVDQDTSLYGDRDRLKRVLLNLLRNAVQACSPGQRVRLLISALNDDERLIEVSDDGCGIAPDMLERVERPFFTTREKGTGLGLALTRKIVEAHRGSLRLESIQGEGTTVRITLPFSAEEQSEAVAATEGLPEGWLG
ncbi:MAG: ATP-binding protein [Myxococcota bacterium]|jgi:signal transduction histidine kinase|nr:ATP-binding protein [Myxococcota bacterium]